MVPSSLETGEAPTKERTTQQQSFIELCRPPNFAVAMLIKQMLEQNGVLAWVKGGHSLAMFPQLMFGGELKILVEASSYEYAWQLYQAYFAGGDEETFSDEE